MDDLEIIRALAKGIEPHTGEFLAPDNHLRNEATINALNKAVLVMKAAKEREERKQNPPENAGKSWDATEDETLIAAFDAGKTIRELSIAHNRTEGAIQARLLKHGIN